MAGSFLIKAMRRLAGKGRPKVSTAKSKELQSMYSEIMENNPEGASAVEKAIRENSPAAVRKQSALKSREKELKELLEANRKEKKRLNRERRKNK